MSKVEVFYPSGDVSQRFVFSDWAADPMLRPCTLEIVAALSLDAEGSAAAELAFAICNSYPDEMHCPEAYRSDVERWRAVQQRSMSVGDVVRIGDDVWICASMGFRVLDDHDLEGVTFLKERVPGAAKLP